MITLYGKKKRKIHLYIQKTLQGDSESIEKSPEQNIYILELKN